MDAQAELKIKRAERERARRAAMKAAGIKVERSEDYKAKHREQERERRKTGTAKLREREYRRQYRDANREQYRAYSREHQRKRRSELKALGLADKHAWTPEQQREYRLRDPERYAFMKRASNYGISIEAQRAMIAAQGNVCANLACLAPLSGRSMQLDHCHRTGKVRAFLCGHCNAALGRMDDDPIKLEGLAGYIRKHQALPPR